jgi:prepilin-type N-terminal cleavage/methylation domain-containing protein
LRRLRRLLRGDGGYSLVELLTVMVVLSVVLGGLTTVFVRGSNNELDLNRRFVAQEEARTSLDKLRRDAHCSSNAWPASASSITLSDPCASTGYVSWCTVAIAGTSPALYGLYRTTTSSCDATGNPWSKNLTTGSIFTTGQQGGFTQQSTSSLAKLHVDLVVNPKPSLSQENYELVDDIAFRNTGRTCLSQTPTSYASPSPPC